MAAAKDPLDSVFGDDEMPLTFINSVGMKLVLLFLNPYRVMQPTGVAPASPFW
jgi:hypothetical protein